MLLTEGQASDHRGAALMLPQLPAGARELIGDRGYDSARYRADLTARGITPCIPSTRSRKVPIPHDKALYRQRHRIENMIGRLKGSRHCLGPPHRHALRQVRPRLLQRNHPRRNRHLLA